MPTVKTLLCATRNRITEKLNTATLAAFLLMICSACNEQQNIPSTEASTYSVQDNSNNFTFKGLYLGMHIYETCNIIDNSIVFDYRIESVEGSQFNPKETDYTIFAKIGGNTIVLTEIRVDDNHNSIFRPILNPVDEILDSKLEESFNVNKDMELSVNSIVSLLNHDLPKFILRSEENTAFALMFENIFEFNGIDNNVQRILLSGSFVNAWFNVKDLSAEEFVQEFINAYDIASMDYFMGDFNDNARAVSNNFLISDYYDFSSGWSHKSEDGFHLIISAHKSIAVISIPKSEERRFD